MISKDSLALPLCLFLTFCPSMPAVSETSLSVEESRNIREKCIEIGTKYVQYLDTGESEKIADLFDEQGTWIGNSAKYIGRESIRAAFAQRPKNRRTIHLVSSYSVDIVSRNLALVVSNFVLYRADGDPVPSIKDQPVRAGRYRDECSRWR